MRFANSKLHPHFLHARFAWLTDDDNDIWNLRGDWRLHCRNGIQHLQPIKPLCTHIAVAPTPKASAVNPINDNR
eukprot:5636583-Amphidinium_carterae.2